MNKKGHIIVLILLLISKGDLHTCKRKKEKEGKKDHILRLSETSKTPPWNRTEEK